MWLLLTVTHLGHLHIGVRSSLVGPIEAPEVERILGIELDEGLLSCGLTTVIDDISTADELDGFQGHLAKGGKSRAGNHQLTLSIVRSFGGKSTPKHLEELIDINLAGHFGSVLEWWGM